MDADRHARIFDFHVDVAALLQLLGDDDPALSEDLMDEIEAHSEHVSPVVQGRQEAPLLKVSAHGSNPVEPPVPHQ